MNIYLHYTKCVFWAIAVWSIASGQATGQAATPFEAGMLLVQLHGGENCEAFAAQFETGRRAGGGIAATCAAKRLGVVAVHFDTSLYTEGALRAALEAMPTVRAVQRNRLLQPRQAQQQPNDLYFDEQWDMDIIGARAAWDISTGGTTSAGDTIVIAIIDSGCDFQHQDLLPNLWFNRQEIRDGLDNDLNGYADDLRGWNWQTASDAHLAHAHGTAVAGIVGAKGNNQQGVTGVNWAVKMMVLSQALSELQVVQGYEYALDMRLRYDASGGSAGAFVVATTIAYGYAGDPATTAPIWCAVYDALGAAGILSVAAAPNAPIDVEAMPDIPTSCTSPFLITVTNTDAGDTLRASAAFGRESVDLGAPGSTSFTTALHNTYNYFSGTSAATPHVAGAIGLLYALPDAAGILAKRSRSYPAETALLIKSLVLKGVDPKATLRGKTVSGGRLNVANSMAALRDHLAGYKGGAAFVVNVFPNPTEALFNIELYSGVPQTYRLGAYTSAGQLVWQQPATSAEAGFAFYRIQANNWQRGLYWIRVENGAGEHLQTPLLKL